MITRLKRFFIAIREFCMPSTAQVIRSIEEKINRIGVVQYKQSAWIAEIAMAVNRIEKIVESQNTEIDVELAKAIEESKIHTDALKKAIEAQKPDSV